MRLVALLSNDGTAGPSGNQLVIHKVALGPILPLVRSLRWANPAWRRQLRAFTCTLCALGLCHHGMLTTLVRLSSLGPLGFT